MNHKLANIKSKNIESLKSEVLSGSKFIVFNYRIGLGFVSLLRFSPAILIKKQSELEKYKAKYNRLNLFFGPWFIFKGPFLTYSAYKTNKSGRLDVTKDIMLNLTQKDLNKNEVEIKKLHNVFSKLPKSEIKDITKALKKIDSKIVPFKNIYVALFDNVEEYQQPYTTIGFELFEDIDLNIEHIKEILYKRFYKHVYFEIFDLKNDKDFGEKLIEQGDLIRF